ncbi:hypothetical protein [Streptomyces sp. NPDC005805]|uniref:hypothetical protein n=1 Tax=Streptomyces sp. NPDC005805 TaxID=3157068 RepID=UPI00340E6F0C
MLSTPHRRTGSRAASVVNAEIRALWCRGMLTVSERERYRELLAEWAEAVRAEDASAHRAARAEGTREDLARAA